MGGGTDFPHWYDEHGGAVLSATIDHFVRVTVEPREDRQVRVRSLDLGHLVEYGLDEGPEYDGVMDLAKAAIDRIGRARRRAGGHRIRSAPGQRLGRILGPGHRGGRGARHAAGARDDADRACADVVRDRTRRPRHQRRVAGPVRGGLRRLQPDRVPLDRRPGDTGGQRARPPGRPAPQPLAVLHGQGPAQRRPDRHADRAVPQRARGDAARHEAAGGDGLRDARGDRGRRRRAARRRCSTTPSRRRSG